MGVHTDKEIEEDKNRLNINVTGIVIGVLITIAILAWIAVVKTLCEHIIEDDRKDRYECIYRKVMAAVILSLIAGFITVACFVYYQA